ncbi:MAG: hypothetical protein HIU84_09085 [Acidobacteria bacterium]|nr:hypothetical protein [Acidobacteriota bacterium]
MSDPTRNREARTFAEAGLVRLVTEYGATPDFVLLGGLVPDLLCSQSTQPHEGTTDVDVQVDLEIQSNVVNARRLEIALEGSGFKPSTERIWRWKHESIPGVVVKIEFLADLAQEQNHSIIKFDDCASLGATNLRGTGYASRDWELRSISSELGAGLTTVDVRVATLAAYLLAKTHAAYDRSLEKDWYDIAYVALHNDAGGPVAAGRNVRQTFQDELTGQTHTALGELRSNFADANSQGCIAYAQTVERLHPGQDTDVLANNAVAAISEFFSGLDIASF